jgi:uncharacterized protein YwqG
MTSKVEHLEEILQPDRMASQITDLWFKWESMRQVKKNDWEEIRRYVYATDTTQTGNSSLPWKNKTTVPKLCQIMDNLLANYKFALFPQRKNLDWMANEKDSNSKRKRDAILNYMNWVLSQPQFKSEMDKILLDYVQFGNCFAMPEWIDQRVKHDNGTQTGYVGPMIRRISPLDIVFNPTAESFHNAPKIIRTLISRGDLKEMLERLSVDDNREEYEEMWRYLKEIRDGAANSSSDWQQRDSLYSMDGFSSFREYLASDTVEVLTFYGDLYDPTNDKLWKNHVITVVDRHKLIGKKPIPSYFGYPPIFHAAWRKKQDNLWGMGPLDNLVGLQYRMDHVENMKADIYDLITYPVQKIKGFVEDFTWQPGEKIYVSEEGDVEIHAPDVNALQANFEVQNIERLMEEMAGAPKEAMGFRTPGEKTKYEVQRQENASSRIFQNKTLQFSEDFEEPLYTALLEMARRLMTGVNTINVFDDELKFQSFQSLTAEDITGVGRIKPTAARHFAEQAELVQNLTSLSQSQMWPVVQPHFSSIKLAKIFEKVFNLEDYEVVVPFIALSEQAMGQQQAQALQEQVLQATTTASGMGEDFDMMAQPVMTPEMQPQQ